jgi:protein-disulfide isomerase
VLWLGRFYALLPLSRIPRGVRGLRPVLLSVLLVVTLSGLRVLSAQSPASTGQADRLRSLEDAVRALDSKVTELSGLLRALLPPSPIVDVLPFELDVTNAPTQGAANAKAVVVEFSDFECPFCGRHAQTTYRDLLRKFVDTGLVRYVFRHLPLEQLHPSAVRAATGAECARQQGKFWEMHDRLFANQKALGPSDLLSHAKGLRLDEARFQACMDGGTASARVRADLTEAERLNLTATPAFLIGDVMSSGAVRITRRIDGAHPLPIFQSAIEAVLANPRPDAK